MNLIPRRLILSRILAALFTLPIYLVLGLQPFAQQRVDVSGVAQSLLPLSVANFASDQRAGALIGGEICY